MLFSLFPKVTVCYFLCLCVINIFLSFMIVLRWSAVIWDLAEHCIGGISGAWWAANGRLSGRTQTHRLSGNPTLRFGWLRKLAGWFACWMSTYCRCILGKLWSKRSRLRASSRTTEKHPCLIGSTPWTPSSSPNTWNTGTFCSWFPFNYVASGQPMTDNGRDEP